MLFAVFATMYRTQSSYGFSWLHLDRSDGKAPIAVSGDVFLKVSNDSGKTFGKDINLSLSEGITSDRIHIKTIDDKVYVTWWDRNLDGSDIPLMRISDDRGQTFGDKIFLSSNSSTTANTANVSSP